MSFETRRYLAYFQRFAFVANVGASPELSAELRAALAEYPGHSGDEAFAFATFADADAARAARGGGAREAPAGRDPRRPRRDPRRRPRREPRGDVRRVGLGG